MFLLVIRGVPFLKLTIWIATVVDPSGLSFWLNVLTIEPNVYSVISFAATVYKFEFFSLIYPLGRPLNFILQPLQATSLGHGNQSLVRQGCECLTICFAIFLKRNRDVHWQHNESG